MGARTTWKIVSNEDTAVWLYGHWSGGTKFQDTQEALAKAEPRWTDSTYGARIFISQIIGDAWDSETGFGITSTLIDSPNPFEESYFDTTLDFSEGTITIGDKVWSFAEFIALPDLSEELTNAYWAVEV